MRAANASTSPNVSFVVPCVAITVSAGGEPGTGPSAATATAAMAQDRRQREAIRRFDDIVKLQIRMDGALDTRRAGQFALREPRTRNDPAGFPAGSFVN